MRRHIWGLVALVVTGSIGVACADEPTASPRSGQQLAAQEQAASAEPARAIAPFDAEQAGRHQEAWAAYLGVPVEITNSIGMRLVLIPPGEFMMGSSVSAEETARAALEAVKRDYGGMRPPIAVAGLIRPKRFQREHPHHLVRLTAAFYLAAYEVTQEQFSRLMREIPRRVGGPEHPEYNVTWEVANEFCRRLSALREEAAAGRTYRLPTEAEWEYACRAGSTTQYWFGDDASVLAKYESCSTVASSSLHRVGDKLANAWRLYDMSGNACEWCADWYGEDYYGRSPVDDPQGPPTGTSRVVRGSVLPYSVDFRAAFRSQGNPNARDARQGVRVAFDVPAKAGQPAEGR